jgi:hypothetical protein
MHSYQSSIGHLLLTLVTATTSLTSATASDVMQGVRDGCDAIVADAIILT